MNGEDIHGMELTCVEWTATMHREDMECTTITCGEGAEQITIPRGGRWCGRRRRRALVAGTKVGRDVFEASAGRLRVVGRAGVGIDNVDLAAATEHGCLVVNAPTANTVAAAEHGIALLTAMSRNIAQADASLKAGKWQRNKYVGVSLVGKTLAILGFGKVGSEVARRAKGLGMHVIAHDPYASADRARAIGVELVSMEEAMTTADFISLHMPLTPWCQHSGSTGAVRACTLCCARRKAWASGCTTSGWGRWY
ncbi:hypothetical protein GUJ93_ZPchr0001g29767 [Zizania palustris]|uniref:D-isomer specific 2-hydroxyacid dehydrogenase NAD-binding domain-containing protein n=1 Tax=Zizania palustris TaxID=103762 RepID=A0A8J5RNF1_ZIZPA|nr:hypothetical protein GUJ93_ZPchr0001g29767 [Zizania palustris]